MQRRRALHAIAGLVAPAVAGVSCQTPRATRNAQGSIELVFKYQPLGDAAPLHALLRAFEERHPGVRVVAEALPNASDVAHQYFLTALDGGASDIDLFIVDVVWVAEFARAGFLLDISSAITPADVRRDFLANAARAVIIDDKTVAVPWYVDTGILYYRTDLVPRAPRTYEELVRFAESARRDHPQLSGFVWQGRQYEGLVCNVYEAIWGHGGETSTSDGVGIRSAAAANALRYLQSLLERGTSPPSVASTREEEARRVFQAGRAVFMRNWPYAFAEAEGPNSPIRGRSQIAALPTLRGDPGAGVLGGYELALSREIAPHKIDLALALLAHLTSHDANVVLATAYGRNPARRSAYDDRRIKEEAPLVPALLPLLARARPRPITPYYAMISDILQGEFSAAISGLRDADEALRAADARIAQLTEML
jgi:multiple sugar transport system substrate-binding protein